MNYKLLIAAALIASLAANSLAQEYPAKAIRIIVPFTPGAGNDIQGRILARKFQESMAQSVIVDNRPGAAGMRSVKELVALAKVNPGKLNAGSSGSGASIHLAIELFQQLAGVKITHVPYKGGAQALSALMSGEVDLNFQGALPSLPVIRAGKVRALAVTTTQRSAAAPDLPTVASFIPGFESVNWFALFAPAQTPAPIVSKLAAETAKAFRAPEVRELLLREGIEPIGSTPAELGIYFRNDVERTAKLIKSANIKVD